MSHLLARLDKGVKHEFRHPIILFMHHLEWNGHSIGMVIIRLKDFHSTHGSYECYPISLLSLLLFLTGFPLQSFSLFLLLTTFSHSILSHIFFFLLSFSIFSFYFLTLLFSLLSHFKFLLFHGIFSLLLNFHSLLSRFIFWVPALAPISLATYLSSHFIFALCLLSQLSFCFLSLISYLFPYLLSFSTSYCIFLLDFFC